MAISNSRLISADAHSVAFWWKDYRIKRGDRMRIMRLAMGEFIRRFLIHVLPDGFHRIRHYGLFASAKRKETLSHIRTLLGATPSPRAEQDNAEAPPLTLRPPLQTTETPCIRALFVPPRCRPRAQTRSETGRASTLFP